MTSLHFSRARPPKWPGTIIFFAERTAELYFARKRGTAPSDAAERIFLDTLTTFHLKDEPAGRQKFEAELLHAITQIPDFTPFPVFEQTPALSAYSRALVDAVIGPLNRSGRNRRRSTDATPTLDGNPALLVTLAVRLSRKMPHELTRHDILRAAYYDGHTIANRISQVFTRYKVEQYSWAHTEGESGRGTFGDLLDEYRENHTPPWVLLGRSLDRLREASDDPQLFNFEFSNPENDKLGFATHRQYSFATRFRNRTTGTSYPIESLSSGETILMSLCMATFNQTMGQRRPKLLLLDELDAVLHPSMISALITGLKHEFVDNGTQVMMATHSITTVSALEEGEVYRIVRDRGKLDVRPVSKSEAMLELSEGVATIDKGLRIVASKKSCPITILTEGHNALHLKKWASLFFPEQVGVFDDLPSRTGKDQLSTYGQFLSKVVANTHFLIVWDCDAKGHAKRLADELGGRAAVTAFALGRRNNTIARTGIENKYPEDVLRPFSKIVLDGATRVETACQFDGGKKTAFARHIFQKGTRHHFVHFDDLHNTVADALRKNGVKTAVR